MKKETPMEIIKKELGYWVAAYPRNKTLLNSYTYKLILELKLKFPSQFGGKWNE